MILLYSDLMDLLCTISDLFAERDGEECWRTVLRIGKVFWVPFDEHFAHFQQKFRAHQTILDVEKRHSNACSVIRIRLDSLKTWIGAHPWTPAFEESKRKRSPGTSTWIFSHPGYKWWSDPSTGSEEGRDSFCTLESTRVLSIQAKPGYGKSVLCGSIIQDLQQKAEEKNRGNDGTTSAVAYYFSDKQRSIQDDNTGAIRSIIAQLIHQYQDRPDLVDLALILRDFSTTGETTASIQDLRDLFALTLQAIGDSALVFDGLDECADVDNFLEELEGITRLSKTRILFSSRPSVNYKGFFQSCTRTVLLEGDTNLQDIETYLHSAIGRLIRSEALMLEDSAQDTVHSIAQKSRSMFLWASLMINYLSSEMMTQQDKIDAIREMSLFPELDSLYTRILKKLYSWHSHASARRNLQLLFEWICVAARPLRVSELQCALAIQIGRKTTQGREIANFEQHLVRNTGALVEVAGDNTVKFIHTSVLEFFMGAMEDSAVLPTRQPELKVDANGVQCAIASTCLSYLIFNGPKAPISTVIGPPVTPQMIVAKYPLILYATQFWSYHAFRSIEQWEIVSNKIDVGHDPPKRGLVQMMTAFLSNKPVVTTWTEIAWTAGHEPCLNGLPFLTWKLSLLRDSPLGEVMKRFCQDLSTLNLQYLVVLRGPGRPADEFRFSRFEFVAYRDHGYTEPQPDFKVVSRILSTVYPGSGNFAFHPTQPILAISRISVTVLWFFEEPDTNLVTISSPLSGLSFSRCGNYIHGHSTERDPNYSIVNITKFVDAVVPKPISSSSSHDQTQGSTLSIRSRIPEAQHQQSQQFLAKSSLPSTMSSNEIAFSKQDSRLQISMVRQLNESGEVLLQKISENGLLVTECIMRLPMSSHLEGTHVTTLNLFNQTEDVQVILNKTLQETYSVDETKPDDIRLPLLVTRTQRPIPQDRRKRPSPLELLGGDMKKRH
ncbi:hypothetical protein CEP53_007589 [Fusarium sp. AF-6]|nr:hypothetical protein CEP53_007589 [Fusarium sp. AF-6]